MEKCAGKGQGRTGKDRRNCREIAGKRQRKELGNARGRERNTQKRRKITEKERKGRGEGRERVVKLTRRKWLGKDRKMHQKRGKGQVYRREIEGEGRGRTGKGQTGKGRNRRWEKAWLEAGKDGVRMGKGQGKSWERAEEEGEIPSWEKGGKEQGKTKRNLEKMYGMGSNSYMLKNNYEMIFPMQCI